MATENNEQAIEQLNQSAQQTKAMIAETKQRAAAQLQKQQAEQAAKNRVQLGRESFIPKDYPMTEEQQIASKVWHNQTDEYDKQTAQQLGNDTPIKPIADEQSIAQLRKQQAEQVAKNKEIQGQIRNGADTEASAPYPMTAEQQAASAERKRIADEYMHYDKNIKEPIASPRMGLTTPPTVEAVVDEQKIKDTQDPVARFFIDQLNGVTDENRHTEPISTPLRGIQVERVSAPSSKEVTEALDRSIKKDDNLPNPNASWRSIQRANAAQERYNELVAVYPNPTIDQIEAALGNDTLAWQSVYGNGKGRFGTMLGRGAMWGRVDSNTMKGLEERRKALEEAKKKQTDAQQEIADAADSITRGNPDDALATVTHSDGSETNVTTADRDKLKAWADKVGYNIHDISPEQVKELQKIITDMGFPVKVDGIAGTQTIPTVIKAMMNSLPEEDADALEDALSVVGTQLNPDGTVTLPHTITFEELQAQRDAEKERIDLRTRQRELERKQARIGLADIAASIGDMIRASQGANVSNRDLKEMYNSLTAQQQANYDAYVARTQKMKEDAKAAAARQRERNEDKAYQSKEAEKNRNWQAGEAEKNRLFQAEEAEKNRQMQERIASNKLQAELKKLDNQVGRENVNKVIQNGGFVWKGALYGTGGSGGNNTIINRIYGILSKYSDFNKYANGIYGDYNLEGAEGRQSAINAAVNGWIAQKGDNLDENISKEIQSVLDNGLTNGYIVKVVGRSSEIDSSNIPTTIPTTTTDSTEVVGNVR